MIRSHFILQELSELALAWFNEDRDEVLDAVGDLMYVIVGTTVTFGHGETKPLDRDPFPWRLEILVRVICSAMTSDMNQWHTRVMCDSMIMFCAAVGIPLEQVFDIVHASNMTKVVGGLHPKGETFILPDFSTVKWEFPHD